MAHHEAGHALVAYLLGAEVAVACVRPDGSGEVTFAAPMVDADRALVDLAGPLAHNIHLCPNGGTITYEPGRGTSDFESYAAMSKSLACSDDLAVAAVTRVLESFWPEVSAIAAALLSKGALTGVEVAHIVEERA
ncbi:MAG: hypothetical protein ACHQ9S_27115 [Candidatus Binatia bacterium]